MMLQLPEIQALGKVSEISIKILGIANCSFSGPGIQTRTSMWEIHAVVAFTGNCFLPTQTTVLAEEQSLENDGMDKSHLRQI